MCCSLDGCGRTNVVQSGIARANARGFAERTEVFHKDFHSFCEELMTVLSGDVT